MSLESRQLEETSPRIILPIAGKQVLSVGAASAFAWSVNSQNVETAVVTGLVWGVVTAKNTVDVIRASKSIEAIEDSYLNPTKLRGAQRIFRHTARAVGSLVIDGVSGIMMMLASNELYKDMLQNFESITVGTRAGAMAGLSAGGLRVMIEASAIARSREPVSASKISLPT